MPHSDPTSKLPKWPFLAGDAALLGAAWLIAQNSPHPYPPEMTLAIVACVIVATIVGAIPFLADYARRQDEALDERQRALESLSQTVTSAAEQIGIAVRGFQELAEQAQKNRLQAESLPQKKGAAVRDEEKEELKKELAARRSAEADRIEAAADKVAQAAAEWIRLETASQKHLAAAKNVLTELDEKVARAKAQPRPKPTPSAPAPEAASAPKVAADLRAAEPPALSKPDDPAPIVGQAVGLAPGQQPGLPPPETSLPSEPLPKAEGLAPSQEPPLPIAEPTPAVAAPSPDLSAAALATAEASPPAETPPKPPRKRAPRKPPVETPSPAEVPVAAEAPVAAEPSAEPLATPAPSLLEQPSLEFSQTAADEASPTVAVAADGATRLLVTAYIGIGNRLFLRGEGPGLSWERGVPLQFVSIGKWKWETADAVGPVTYKLYKNDVTECTALASRPLEPGQQQEVTATF